MASGTRDRQPRTGDALVLVDVQNDFLPGGNLAVPHGDEVLPPLNEAVEAFERRTLPVIATRDWHPPDHCSFRTRGGPWPPHCVIGSPGAEFAPALRLPATAIVVSKPTLPDRDVFNGFEGTGLDGLLRRAGVTRVFVGGLATDYCVLHTVLGARRAGFDVVLLLDAIRAVEVTPGDGERAIAAMRDAGAVTATWAEMDRPS